MVPLTRELLDRVFTAETLMTPREELLTWTRGADLAGVKAEVNRLGFDLIPVAESGRIVGVLPGNATEPEPLTDQWLVSRDTGISDLLSLFVHSDRAGFLVFHRQEVIGLVTPADLNKLPACVYFYNLVGELELTLSDLIRHDFRDDPGSALATLSKERQEEIRSQQGELTSGNADLAPLQLLRLSDLINIVVRQECIRDTMGFRSRESAEKAFSGLVDFRNRTMHLVRPLPERVPEDLQRLHKRVGRIREILHRLEVRS